MVPHLVRLHHIGHLHGARHVGAGLPVLAPHPPLLARHEVAGRAPGVALVKHLNCQQLQGPTVNAALRREESLESVICFARVCGAGVEDDLPIDVPGRRVPAGRVAGLSTLRSAGGRQCSPGGETPSWRAGGSRGICRGCAGRRTTRH